MKAEVNVENSRLDGLKWLVSVVLITCAVIGNHYFSAESLLYRVLGVVFLLIIAGLVAFQTTKGKRFWVLLGEARTEIRKVVWPTRQETLQTTMIVVAFVLVAALILWGIDSLTSMVVSGILG